MSIQGDVNYLIDKMIEQEKQNKELADRIMGEAEHNNEILIEEVKKQQVINELIASEELTEEERVYCQSPYFQNYLRFIKDGIDVVVRNIQNNIIIKYNYNMYFYKDPFIDPFKGPGIQTIDVKEMISNLGFPVPAKFINKILALVTEKLGEMGLDELLGIDCEVSIVDCEYGNLDNRNNKSRTNNVTKNINGYILNVKAKQKENIKDKQIG